MWYYVRALTIDVKIRETNKKIAFFYIVFVLSHCNIGSLSVLHTQNVYSITDI